MFSPSHYSQITGNLDLASGLESFLYAKARVYDLQAAFLLQVDIPEKEIRVRATVNIPPEPFNGSEKRFLIDAISDAFAKHSNPHIHGISALALSGILRRLGKDVCGANKMWFVPFRVRESSFIFLGVPKHDCKLKSLPDGLIEGLGRDLGLLEIAEDAAKLGKRLQTTEKFSREIGHDIASSVQAVLAKAKTITQKRVTGDGALRKAKEIELEIMAIYRHSESLGIALDSEYKIDRTDLVDLIDVCGFVVDSFRNEAEERHIRIHYEANRKSIEIHGDPQSIGHAFGQILLNAIKYACGNSTIYVNLKDESDCALFEVKNVGIPLPELPERRHIWEFGIRSKEAKELHVNGSGIGLFTVRRIVLAHNGIVFAESEGKPTTTVRIGFRLPKGMLIGQ